MTAPDVPADHPDQPDQPGEPPPRRGLLGWVAGLVAIVVGAAVVIIVLRSEKATPFLSAAQRGCGTKGALIPVGGTMPMACDVETLPGGDPQTLARYAAGKPMVINFWASWCESCIQEMPDLQKVYLASGDHLSFLGLDLLGVQGEDRTGAQEFARERAVTYPLAYDDDALLYGRISQRFLAPLTALVKPDGTLAYFHPGQYDAAGLEQAIGQYLGVQVAG